MLEACPWDYFVVLDGAWKLVHGYIPSVDFYSPIGPITYLITAAGLKVSSMSINSASIGLVMAGIPLAAISWFLCAKKAPPIYCVAFCSFIIFNWLSPFPYRSYFWFPSYAGLYNREGTSLLMLLMVVLLSGRSISKKGMVVENFIVGSILGIVLFTKISYFVAALALLPISLFKYPCRILRCAWIALGLAISSLAILIPLHLNLYLMYKDLQLVGLARSQEISADCVMVFFADALPLLGAFLAISLLEFILLSKRGEAISRISYLSLAEFPFISIAVFLVIFSNSPDGSSMGMPLLQFYGLLLSKNFVENLGSIFLSTKELIFKYATIAFCMVCFIDGPLWDFGGITYTFCYKILGKDSGLHIVCVLPQTNKSENKYECMQVGNLPYYLTVTDGLNLLAKHPELNDCSIGSFDLSDSFDFVLKHRPAPGMPTCWQDGRMNSEKAHPLAEKTFKGCDCLMIPKWEKLLPKIYGAYIAENYVQIDRTDTWVLYRRELYPHACAGNK